MSEFEAVIVDNYSSDGAIDELVLPDGRFSILQANENTGFAGGSNLGLQGAETHYVMTVNPDTSLSKNCLKELRSGAEAFPNAAMFSPVLFNSEATDKLDGAGDSLSMFGLPWRNGSEQAADNCISNTENPFEVFSPTGAAALYLRSDFEKEDGFDTQFFCYLEDVDLALRLRARGKKCWLIPKATGVHIGGHSSDTIPGFALEQSVKNGLGMIIKSAPLLLSPIMLVSYIAAHMRFQYRNRGTQVSVIRKAGFKRGVMDLPKSFGDRLRRRPYPIGASLRVAKALSWSIKDVKTRPLRRLNSKR